MKRLKNLLNWLMLNKNVVYHLVVLFFIILSSFFALLFSRLYYDERNEYNNYRRQVIKNFERLHINNLNNQDTIKLNQDSIKNWVRKK